MLCCWAVSQLYLKIIEDIVEATGVGRGVRRLCLLFITLAFLWGRCECLEKLRGLGWMQDLRGHLLRVFVKTDLLVEQNVSFLSGKCSWFQVFERLNSIIVVFKPVRGVYWLDERVVVASLGGVTLVHNYCVELVGVSLLFERWLFKKIVRVKRELLGEIQWGFQFGAHSCEPLHVHYQHAWHYWT